MWEGSLPTLNKMPKISCLHGFLGLSTDFDGLKLNTNAINIFRTEQAPLSSWAKRYNFYQKQEAVLMGYSMGGRLALHCLLENPKLYKAAIILAAHPGLKTKKDQEKRWQNDCLWAQAFLQDPWSEIIDRWQQQPALKNSQNLNRDESSFDRRVLSKAMKNFSLAQQDFLIPKLKKLDLPILWLCPANETNNIAGLILKNKKSKIVILKTKSHRFLVDEPQIARPHILSFLNDIFNEE